MKQISASTGVAAGLAFMRASDCDYGMVYGTQAGAGNSQTCSIDGTQLLRGLTVSAVDYQGESVVALGVTAICGSTQAPTPAPVPATPAPSTDGPTQAPAPACPVFDHCAKFRTPPACGCKSCVAGYQLASTTCVECITAVTNCKTYQATTAKNRLICGCKTCPAGFEFVGGYQCRACDTSIYNCKAYLATTSNNPISCGCKSCLRGFTLSNEVCASPI